MSLFKLKAASTILIEDDYNKNVVPLVSELIDNLDCNINIICYEQPVNFWQNVINNKSVQCFEEFKKELCNDMIHKKTVFIIDSVNQMALDMGWNECLKNIRNLQNNSNVTKLILILHKDCLLPTSKLHAHLNHIADAIVNYDTESFCTIHIQIKRNGKYFKSRETIEYKSSTLKLTPIVNISINKEEPEKIQPGNLTTFKIETDQTQQLEKHKLKLPYMSKINEGKGKVYYEPDAVDDWDDEDPDDDLDI